MDPKIRRERCNCSGLDQAAQSTLYGIQLASRTAQNSMYIVDPETIKIT